MSEEPKPKSDRSHRDNVGWNDLTEDVFGLSVRGIVTLRDLILRPGKVFAAARRKAWGERYTPSLRLVASLIAVMLLLRVFWAAEDSAMYQNVLRALQIAAEGDPTIGDPATLASRYFAAWALCFPVAYFLFHLIAAASTRIWGSGTDTVVRFRLYFAALIPGLAFAILGLVALPFQTSFQAIAFSSTVISVAAVIYAATVYFGLRHAGMGVGARLWRGGLFAFVASLFDTLTAIAAAIAASLLMAAIRYGYVVPGLE